MSGDTIGSGQSPHDGPPSLWDTALRFCAKNPDIFSTYNPGYKLRKLNDNVYFTQVMCESIIDNRRQLDLPLDDEFMSIFAYDNRLTPLTKLKLRNSLISDRVLQELLSIHHPEEIDIVDCTNIDEMNTINIINQCGDKIRCLFLPKLSKTLRAHYMNIIMDGSSLSSSDEHQEPVPLLTLKNLRAFSCTGLQLTEEDGILALSDRQRIINANLIKNANFDLLLNCVICNIASQLNWFELTHSRILQPLEFFPRFHALNALVLHDVSCDQYVEKFTAIQGLKQLRALDISMSGESPTIYPEPNKLLHDTISSLPLLQHIDISGTNLAGSKGLFMMKSQHFQELNLSLEEIPDEHSFSPIPGIPSDRKLIFLGLLRCPDNPCRRKMIPSNQITGDANEEQTILSIEVYVERASLLVNALNHLFHIMRFSECHQLLRALHAILAGMKRHPYNRHVQISGSASIFYIVKSHLKHSFTNDMKRKITSTLISGMQHHIKELNMIRNSCLTLTYFSIPNDVLLSYDKLARILLFKLRPGNMNDELVHRIIIFLLNGMTGKVSNEKKVLLGELHLMEGMIDLIRRKIVDEQPDEIMETAWGTMWNITDETPCNSERFLRNGGMTIITDCYDKFHHKKDIMFSMMGLIGNIAEQTNLHSYLMNDKLLTAFLSLMESREDNIQLSYNCCSVFAYLLSEPSNWENYTASPTLHEIRDAMVLTINSWSISTRMVVNYRSLTPMILLINCESAESQLWSSWAISNICKCTPETYVPLLMEIDGLKHLNDLINRPSTHDIVRDIAKDIINTCKEYLKK